ncbi:MAG: ribosome biogenesis GTPase Der, partial [Clostridiales bacterium]|nr:ribosome biogenesis GTPase Der [Clostridiales bacterium]
DGGRIRVCAIGRPNVGKSSLVNRMVGSERLIVSDVAGTTRDAIDVDFDNEFGSFTFIDTAGMRRQSRVDESIEYYSVLRAKMAVERSDVCLIVIDAVDGVTEQDARIAGIAHESGKCSIIVVNKWDLVEKDQSTMNEYTDHVRSKLAYMTYAPVVFVSAVSGQRCDKLYPLIARLVEETGTRITTGRINDMLSDAVIRVQPPTDRGRRLKIFYMTQTGTKPPTFIVFVNRISLFHFSYQRYLENQIREVFGLKNVPIRLIPRQRGETPGGNI